MRAALRAGCAVILAIASAAALAGCAGARPAGATGPGLSAQQKNSILSLTCCAENSRTSFAYDYAEDIGDGRGITFGIIGFTSGTYDGTILLKRVKELDPGNPLVSYLPAFEAIDAMPHDSSGLCSSTAGLERFAADFGAHGADASVKRAQLEKLDDLYWKPAMALAASLGIKTALAAGELYDACVNHGPDGNAVDMGLKQLAANASAAAGGDPRSGVDEKAWLKAFLSVRRAYLERSWPDAIDRIDMYARILASGNVDLKVPFGASCYGDSFEITGAAP